MQYRRLGKTELMVSEIGFGAWGIGGGLWRGGDDATSLRALHLAADQGVNFFDTALAYGDGHSERLIGRFLKERQETLIVATKVPPKNRTWPAQRGVPFHEVFPHEYVIQCAEQSLRNLGVETLDLLQFHVWNDDWLEEPANVLAPIETLRREGKIRFFGISINDHQPENALRLIETGNVDTVQVIFNIFDQSPKRKLFPACRLHDVGVIVRVPFDEGALTGSVSSDTVFPEGDFRSNYFRGDRKRQVEERVNALKALLNDEIRTLAELALRFCLSWDAVSTVIPGMRKPEHVRSNCAVSDGRRLPASLLAELEKHEWPKNFYQ